MSRFLGIRPSESFFPKSWSDERLSKGLAKIAGVGLLISVILACFIPFAEFEHDFRRLRAIKPPKDTTVVQEHSIRTGVANTGQGKSSQPTVVFGDNLKEMYALHDTLIHRMTIEKDPYLQSFITLKTFLPDSLVQDGRLKYIAQMISGGLKTKVYILNVNGFDTHDAQVDQNDVKEGVHANLLKRISDAVRAFQNDLQLLGLEQRVAGLTFSEFGRQIASNGSMGTDHGDAAPVLLFGACVSSGIVGANPQIPNQINNANTMMTMVLWWW